jgi:protein-tyrosine phosphatase
LIVLFLCSGNYYRSRFAEHVFNAQAVEHGIPWRAESRGLALGCADNVGAISKHCVEGLRRRNLAPDVAFRFPLQATEADLRRADLIVALKESEHRPMLAHSFPDWLERVEYWTIHDLDCAEPREALHALEQQICALVTRLRASDATPSRASA